MYTIRQNKIKLYTFLIMFHLNYFKFHQNQKMQVFGVGRSLLGLVSHLVERQLVWFRINFKILQLLNLKDGRMIVLFTFIRFKVCQPLVIADAKSLFYIFGTCFLRCCHHSSSSYNLIILNKQHSYDLVNNRPLTKPKKKNDNNNKKSLYIYKKKKTT